MRLTPADVHNVSFKKPNIGKRGYDEDEVDAFLDIVEVELTRLIEENNELSQRLAAYAAGGAPANGYQAYAEPPAQGVPDNTAEIQAYVDAAPPQQVHEHEAPAAPEPVVQQAPEVQPEPPAPTVVAQAPVVATAAAAGIAEHHLHAARLLGLAEETAERVTSEANIEAENTRSSARAESEKLLSDARNESERMLTEAKNSSESTIADANARAESTVRDSQIKAEALDREAQRKYSEVMTQLTTQRTSLENKIDGLRTYEREYRSRLKNWINDQLHQLDASDGDGTADGPVAVGQGPGQPGSAENNGSPEQNG
jgi:DivIVA domain-containing protein